MKTRIRCPFHREETASLVRQKSNWFCYGACQKAYSQEEVELRVGESVHYEYDEEDDEKEDLAEKFAYIDTLPQSLVRGLRLPCDERGFYIPWPDKSYYKYRLFNPGKGGKYLSPKGHYPLLFWAKRRGSQSLIIVEGEINAMSVASACPIPDVCSPGSASMFSSDNLSKYLHIFKNYSSITVVLDKDAAGIKGLISARAFFLNKIPFVNYLQISPDANETLINEGKEVLREKLQGKNCR